MTTCGDFSLARVLLVCSLGFNAIFAGAAIYASARAERERGERRFAEAEFHTADDRIADLESKNRSYERALITANYRLGEYYARLQRLHEPKVVRCAPPLPPAPFDESQSVSDPTKPPCRCREGGLCRCESCRCGTGKPCDDCPSELHRDPEA